MTNLQKKDYITIVMLRLPALMPKDVKLLIASQFALESNYGTSNMAILQSNHCGMKLAMTRLTTRLPESKGDKFATYDSLKDCITDYLLWLSMMGVTQASNFAYIKALLPKYCPDQGYTERVMNVFNYVYNLLKTNEL